MKHHVPIDEPGRARPVASTANMYTLASVRLLSTATCSSAVKAYTYAYHTCVKRSRVYTFTHSCGRGNGVHATQRLPNVYGHVMFHPRPSPFSMFPSPVQLNARNKSRNGEGLGPRLHATNMQSTLNSTLVHVHVIKQIVRVHVQYIYLWASN